MLLHFIESDRSLDYFATRLNVQTNKFTNFTHEDGLQSFEFKAHAVSKSKWGTFYFGGINGFNEFYPSKIKETTDEAPLVITDFQIFNKKIRLQKTIMIPRL